MVKRRTFTREFKLEILKQIEARPIEEVCREHELHPSVANRWKREQQDYPKTAFQGLGKMYKLEAQLAERDRLIGQLYAENSLLKKVASLEREKRAEERMLRSTK